MREKTNNLLIQKDLLENEFHSLKNSYESEKNSSVCLVNRINELEATIQLINAENSRLKDRESFSLNEMAKMESLLNQLKKEKSSLEYQIKNIELNISENDEINSTLQIEQLSKRGANDTNGGGSDLVNGKILHFKLIHLNRISIL